MGGGIQKVKFCFQKKTILSPMEIIAFQVCFQSRPEEKQVAARRAKEAKFAV